MEITLPLFYKKFKQEYMGRLSPTAGRAGMLTLQTNAGVIWYKIVGNTIEIYTDYTHINKANYEKNKGVISKKAAARYEESIKQKNADK